MSNQFDLTPADDGWQPVGTAPDAGAARSFSQRIASGREGAPYRLAVWRGEPGVYKRDSGMPWSEVFTVYKGKGRLTFRDETIELLPGVVVDLRAGEPYVMEIDSRLEKVAVITVED